MRQLRYVIGISEAGSLLSASRALHVVQPALSHQVALLERELGTALFVRSHRGMRLTPAGHAFVEHARVVLQDVERLRSSVGEADGQIAGTVVLGLPTTVALVATLPILGEVLARHPGVQLKLIESHSGFLGEWLQAGRLDAACAQAGLSLTLVAEIDSLPNIKKAVEAGLAATILSPGAVSDEVKAGRLAVAEIGSPTLLRRVVASHSLTRPMSPAAVAVLQAAEDVVREMVRTKAWPARWVGE